MGLNLGSKIVSQSNEYNYKENCLNEVAECISYKNIAQTSANNALNHSEESKTYMIACQSYSENALESSNKALASENAAKTSEINAKTWAETIDPEVIKNGVISTIYPIGSIYITLNDTNPSETLGIGTWEKVSSGRVLEGSDSSHNAGTTIDAGLPDPQLEFIYRQDSTSSGVYASEYGHDGRTASTPSNTGGTDEYMISENNYAKTNRWADVRVNNNIYGKSTTVQPNAYFVNVWKRTA